MSPQSRCLSQASCEERDSSRSAHPTAVDVDELFGRLDNVPRAREALRVLVDDGIAVRLGDRVGLSRAVTRFDALRYG